MPSNTTLIFISLAAWLPLAGGCGTTRVAEPAVKMHAAADSPSRMAFWYALVDAPVVCNDDALHALLLLADRSDTAAGFEGRLALARERGWIGQSARLDADAAMDRGTLALALARILRIEKSLTRMVAGDSPRYALRSLQFQEIMPEGSPNQLMSGAEFVGILGRVEDYQNGGRVEAPAGDLPPRPEPSAAARARDEIDAIRALDDVIARSMPDERESGDDARNAVLLFAAGESDTRPAAQTRPATERKAVPVTIRAIRGGDEAEWQRTAGAAWEPVKVGLILPPGASLRTGSRTEVDAEALPGQLFTLDRRSQFTVSRAELTRVLGAPKQRMDLELNGTGRLRYNIDAVPEVKIYSGEVEHRSTIRTPNGTLAVRGTRVIICDQAPYKPMAISLTGRAFFRNVRGQDVAFGGPAEQTARFRADQVSAVEFAISRSTVDPTIALARDPAEAALIDKLISRGAVVTYDRGLGIPVVRGGTPPTFGQVQSALPGDLHIVIRWNRDSNLNLAVAEPSTGGILMPAPGLTDTASGGHVNLDHRGGPQGGVEVISWPKGYPSGTYAVMAQLITGNGSGFAIRVYLDGKLLQFRDPNDPLRTLSEYRSSVDKSQPSDIVFFDPTQVLPMAARHPAKTNPIITPPRPPRKGGPNDR